MADTPFPRVEPRVGRVALLAEIATRLLMDDSAEDLARDIFDRVAAELGLDLYVHYLVTADGSALQLAASAGIDADAVRSLARIAFNETVCGTAAARGKRIVVERAQESGDSMAKAVHALGARAYACHPLLARGGLIGTVSFGSRTRDSFTPEEFEIMQTVANQVAVALERTQALCRLERELEERRRVEEALQRSAAILAQAGQMASLGAWDVELANLEDLNTNALHWSDETYRIFGYEPGDVAVSNDLFFQRVHPDDRVRVAETVALALAERRSYSVEHRIVRPDGGERIVLEHADITFDAGGRPLRMTGAVQDVTERRHAEEALRAANARLEEADRRKDEFIAMLSHELRNPLAPIRFALPLLQAERLPQSAARAVAVIDRQLHHLTRLVDDLLDASRVTRGKIELRCQHVTLAAVLTAATEAASPEILAARHTLEVAVDDEPVWLYADAGRLAQVITNLLNNSAKYTPRGGTIALKAAREGGHAVIRVRDTGIGIPADALATVFDMFRQVDRPDRSQGGLGIGLALARQLVELHGGTIQAWSGGAGSGAEFVVRLPLAGDGPEASPARAEARRGQAGPSGRSLKVLVVDDNADLVEMLATLVAGLGHDVRKALDGPSAISAAVSYEPDVVLLDLGLPLLDGIEVARELRRSPVLAKTRLVALTGWGQAEDRRQTEQAGFDFHLTKPADPQTVERLLATFAASR